MKNEVLLFALLVNACTANRTATAVLALEGVPDSVATISASVLDLEENVIVATATIAAPKTSFTLGVPAEKPLEFRVVARTNHPGPPIIGAMPGYYGSTLRTIPLDKDQETVALTLHPAGLLTTAVVVDRRVLGGDETVGISIEAETSGVRPSPFVLAPFDPDRPMKQRTLVLRTGRYDAAIFHDEENGPSEDPAIAGGRGLFVAREVESIAVLHLVEAREPLRPKAPLALALELEGAGDTIELPAGERRSFVLRVRALDATGAEATPDDVDLALSYDAFPPSLVAGRASDAMNVALPIALEGTTLTGTGRLRLRATAMVRGNRRIDGELALNVVEPGGVPSEPVALVLAIEDRALLTEGTRCAIDVVDANGLFAPVRGFVDLSMSDPWVFFADGPGSAIDLRDRGHLRRNIARPSGPRGLPVVVRATLTSTSSPMLSLTSSVALPLLELAP